MYLPSSQPQWRLEKEIQIPLELNTGPSLQQRSVGGLGTLSHYLPQALFESIVPGRREKCYAVIENHWQHGAWCNTYCASQYLQA